MRRMAVVLVVFAAMLAISVVAEAQVDQGAGGGAAPSAATGASAPTAASAGGASAAGAGGGERGMGRGIMRMDTNGDGVITKDEWRGSEESFKEIDANNDGKIDGDEMRAYMQKLRQRRLDGEQGPEGPGGPGGRTANGEMDDQMLINQLRGAERIETLIFRMIDTKNTGKITKQDVDEFAARLMAADTDKDGAVSIDEARKALATNVAKRFAERFMKRYDKNGDGKVTKEEFGASEDVFKKLDANGDGSITADDFTLLATKWIENPESRQGPNGPAAGSGPGPGFGGRFGTRGGRSRGPRGERGGNIESTAPAPQGAGDE